MRSSFLRSPMPTPATLNSPTRSRYWRRLLLVLVILVSVAVIGTPVLAGFVLTYGLMYAPCDSGVRTPADFGHAYENVTIQASAGGTFRAYYIPGENTAAVIIPPPTNKGRGSRLHEADVLARNGYAVLAFESRRCAGMGAISLGYKEVREVGDALAYLQTRADVDPQRIGVLGFSSAGATAVMAAARFSDLRAVIAEGGYGDLAEGAIGLGTGSANPLEAIFKWSLGASYRLLSGVDIDRLSPQDVIGDIAPRPILLIYGSTENSLDGARDQRAAAGANTDLWIVEGAGHGNYLAIAPDAYEQRVIAFLDRALLGSTSLDNLPSGAHTRARKITPIGTGQ